MNGKDATRYITQRLDQLDDQNGAVLIAWLRHTLRELNDRMPEISEWQKLEYSKQLESHKFLLAGKIESYKAAVDYAKVSVTMAFALNGGAAVAVLALIGQYQLKTPPVPAQQLVWTVVPLVVGALAAAISMGATFLVQDHYTQEQIGTAQELSDKAKKSKGDYWRRWAISSTLFSYGAFLAAISNTACFLLR
jgi:hypothetical protein